jgi:osmotically-inducible protein OsmY
MKTLLPVRLPLMGALALAVALAACSRQDDERTAGEKLDSPIAQTKEAAGEAKTKMDQAAAAAAEVVSDATIVTKINAALMADDKLKARKIEVQSTDGRVIMTGTAPDAQSVDRATTLAAAVNGVHAVDNHLVVSAKG